MIKLIRVDYRLLHGQIIVSWISATEADCLLLVSDTVKNDKLRLQALKLAKPQGVKVVLKDRTGAVEALKSGVTDRYKLFVICETIADAAAVARATNFKDINLGNVPFEEGKHRLTRAVSLNADEEAEVRSLEREGYDLYLQMVPSDKKVPCSELL